MEGFLVYSVTIMLFLIGSVALTLYFTSKKYQLKQQKREYIRIKKKPYVYEISYNLLYGILSIGIILLAIFLFDKSKFQKFNTIFPIFIGLWIFMFNGLYFLIKAFKSFRIYIYKKWALAKGKIVPGKILCYCKTLIGYNSYSNNYFFNLVISYKDIYSGQEKLFLTPTLSFNPINTLGSKHCSVIIYKDLTYACDFQTNEETSQTINLCEDNSHLRNSKVNKDLIHNGLYAIIAFIILCILFYLKINI